MADSFLALADLIKVNDMNLADTEPNDLLQDAPLLQFMAAVTASNGTQHKYLKYTTAAGAAFRAINAGVSQVESEDTLVTETLQIMSANTTVDWQLAKNYKGGPDAYIAREVQRKLRSALFAVEQQIIYGTGADSGGFAGLATNALLAAYDDTMVVNGGGSTADTGSSCYLLRTTPDDLAVIAGQDGNIEIGETTLIAADGGSSTTYPAYFTPVEAYMGLQYGSIYSAVRILNLTEDANDGLTDAKIYLALEKFPASRQPNVIVMNRRSLRQLQSSRTATNATGAPAPRPTEVEGIPIIVTDAITSTEAISAA